MNASSVTTLYGNLLPNALESAIASDEKQIELSATWNAEHTVVIISVVNSYWGSRYGVVFCFFLLNA